jgi:hypothetical protein
MKLSETAALASMSTAVPGSFIVTLCALPSPHIPAQTLMAEEKDLRLFISRREVDGRERFYLHAGFLPTLAAAEQWRDTVRSRYPNAFVSRLGSSEAVGTVDPIGLSETQTLRVLEVRAPRSHGSDEEREATGSYAVTSEARLKTSARPSLVAAPFPAPLRSVPVTTPPAARSASATGSSRELVAALRDLATKSDEPEHTDMSGTTGVRHLRIEFARKTKRSRKSASPPRRT